MPSSQLRDKVQSTLGTAYVIQRELTGGGMSRVFLAEDTALGRQVVIKVLSPEKAQGLLADRFAREIRLAARLQHPHIVPLFSAGTIDGLPYYTMPYVEGESLRARLLRDGRISTSESLQILRDTAQALEYAHSHDVVHRDIKPDNILLSGSAACVIDFGIAKAITAARSGVPPFRTAEGDITNAGFAVGTPGYMAPEQVSADPDIDHRVDIYAFGCVAYELLAGKAPFSKPTAQETMVAQMVEKPSASALRRVDVPRGIFDLVMSCLAKSPSERPQSASELLEGISGPGRVLTPADGMAAMASIAVLPFESMSAEKENEFFADGVTEEIINALTQIEGLRVVGRTSSFAFRGTKHDLRIIGEQLNVSTVLEGSVRKSGNRLRITAQLVKVSDGYHLWSERYDRELTDVFAVQDEIATAIAAKLRLSLGHDKVLTIPRTADIEAYELFLKGRILMYSLGHEIFGAVDCFQRATYLDDRFTAAHASLAEALLIAGYSGLLRPSEMIDRARVAAETACKLAPDTAEARHAMAFWLGFYGSDRSQAIREWERAMEVGSQIAFYRCNYAIWGLCLNAQRWNDAVNVIEEGVAADPLNGYTHSMLALVMIFAKRNDDVVATAKRGAELKPESFWGQWSLQRAYQAAGRHEEALRQGALTLAISGRHPWALAELAISHASVGNRDGAEAVYVELTARNRAEYVQPASLARAAVAAGRLDEAISTGHRAVDERDAHIRWAPIDRWEGWSPLYEHPEWNSLKKRILEW
ncbi:MAG: protein kinase [Gemmatimonadales bacterium]